MESVALVVFSKPAVPGRVKTRLQTELSAADAARLHEAFLADTINHLAGEALDLHVAWALEPREEPPDGLLPVAVPVLRQQGNDLGERLFHALEELTTKYTLVAAIGSDHPHIDSRRVAEAGALLAAGTDVVLGPAKDGGYYLVALHRRVLSRALFEGIPWSTGRVLEATLERCQEAGLEVELLAAESDVDTPDDLRRLAALLRRCRHRAPSTAALLEELGWL